MLDNYSSSRNSPCCCCVDLGIDKPTWGARQADKPWREIWAGTCGNAVLLIVVVIVVVGRKGDLDGRTVEGWNIGACYVDDGPTVGYLSYLSPERNCTCHASLPVTTEE